MVMMMMMMMMMNLIQVSNSYKEKDPRHCWTAMPNYMWIVLLRGARTSTCNIKCTSKQGIHLGLHTYIYAHIHVYMYMHIDIHIHVRVCVYVRDIYR